MYMVWTPLLLLVPKNRGCYASCSLPTCVCRYNEPSPAEKEVLIRHRACKPLCAEDEINCNSGLETPRCLKGKALYSNQVSS